MKINNKVFNKQMSTSIEKTTIYELPEVAFKFVYQEAQDPDYFAENLVEELKDEN